MTTPRRISIPWGLLGMLALIAAIERVAIRDNLNVANVQGASWEHAARKLRRAVAGRDILGFGDSLLKNGLLPRVLAERTGRPAFNLALVGGSSPSSYFLLRRAIEAGARPTTLVVDFARDLLEAGPANTARPYPWADLLDTRECLELCWSARDPDLFVRITLARLLPSVKNRHQVRAFIRARLKARKYEEPDFALMVFRNENANDGAEVNLKGSFRDFDRPPPRARLRGTWRPDPTNVHFLNAFLDLAARRKIEVVWLLPPVSPGTQAQWEYSGNEDAYEKFVRAAVATRLNLTVIDGRHSGYEARVFFNAVHLDRDGAMALSAGLADLLRRDRPAPERWAALPDYEPPALATRPEDLIESRRALDRLRASPRGLRR